MKQSDYPRLKKELTLILPIYQVNAWKTMHVSHQDMSDIVLLMLKERLIKRTLTKFKGSRTYLLESLNHKPQKVKDFGSLLAGQMFSPCTGCVLDCLPSHCNKLTTWVTEHTNRKI